MTKQVVESLVLSKMDFCDTVYYPLHEYLIKRFRRVQNASAGFVTNSYCKKRDVINLGWLPTKERRDWHLLKSTHKACHEGPGLLKLETASHSLLLRSSNARVLKMTLEAGTFQNSASKRF